MSVKTPIETRTMRLPAWAVGLTVFALLVGGVYFATNLAGDSPPFAIPGASGPAPGPSGGADPAVGEALISQAAPPCTSCHGPDLAGQADFPSLHGVADGP